MRLGLRCPATRARRRAEFEELSFAFISFLRERTEPGCEGASFAAKQFRFGKPLMTISSAEAIPLTASEHQVQLRRAVIASTIGTTIEWYDFFLYSIVTGLVFAKLFFPHSDPWVGTLEAFAIYAVGFIARPIGAAILGHC
jgi:hypothetical protein